jgi:ABC-2 type transport system ATP-binding protein
MSVSPTPAIIVENLTRRFGKFVAVDNVSFRVDKGEILGFLGANGAGKTTIIRMLCGLLRPTSGRALVGGFDVGREPERVKAAIGYMSQRFSLYDDLTVAENLSFFGGVYGLTREQMVPRLRWALGLAGLVGHESSLTAELAGGWRQRLALACAILHEPGILFLDEPTGGVDPISRRSFWDLINELAAAGTTVFVTTHYLDEAEYCNRVMLIHNGRLIAGGAPSELKAQVIRHPMLEVECDRVIDGLETLRRQSGVKDVSVFGNSLHVVVPDADEGQRLIREALGAQGNEIRHMVQVLPALQDVFISLVEPKNGGQGAVGSEA